MTYLNNPRVNIAMQVLETALDVGNDKVVAACRRIITANTIGWRKHGNPADLRLVTEIYECVVQKAA